MVRVRAGARECTTFFSGFIKYDKAQFGGLL